MLKSSLLRRNDLLSMLTASHPHSLAAVSVLVRQRTAQTALSHSHFLRTYLNSSKSLKPLVSKYSQPLIPFHRPLALQIMAKKDQQHRTHMGHSHSHAHGHDNTYLTSANKHDAGVRITRIGLYVNLGMAVSKGIGGYVFNSKALLADAIHSLTDLVSDIMTLATVSWSLKPPTERFPGGYGKVESLGSLGVSGILLASGVMMGWAGVMALCQQFIPGFEEVAGQLGLLHLGHGHDHSHTDLGPNLNAAWLAAGSIAVKEWLYRASKYKSLKLDRGLRNTMKVLTSII